jgi:hypothetical protein
MRMEIRQEGSFCVIFLFYKQAHHPYTQPKRNARSGNSSTIVPSSSTPMYNTRYRNLRVESEGSANLVGSLVELLGIKGGAEAKGDARAEENVVRESSDTAVIDLDLFHMIYQKTVSSCICKKIGLP